ncbi:MAG: MotA/TolQ/ExbB proton channel family protein [Magnetospirillum sp.]|nr:MotA/TolQ/ExbB proton channel family protein [Magnetospirillum sp.]
MTRPNRFLLRMVLFLAAVTAVAGVLLPGLIGAFHANPGLNGLIFGVFVIGVTLNFRQVMILKPEVEWLEGWRRGQPVLSGARLRLLAPMASMLGERRDRMSLSAMALRSVLDSIAARLEEQRDLARYFVGLLIFLGLLGTFWGLSHAVGSIGDVIRSLSVSGSDASAAFDKLKSGLEAPLGGMGTAFATSLFGLAGSLVVGFLDLQAGQAQNAFYNELEEWLAGQTRLGGGGAVGGDDQPVPAYIQALLEQTADSLDELQRVIGRGEESRIATNASLRSLTDKLSTLTDHMRAEQALMIKLGESQLEMRPLLAKLAEAAGAGSGIDETSRGHLRNIDTALGRLVEETVHSRDEVVAELRSEFKLLARTIAAVAEDASER